jgi:Novel STAND NTPase 1
MSVDLAYPGHRPFRREDSGRFFGRETEAADLSESWLRHRLTFVSGPAGIGKTSLLAAGVLPLVNRHNVDLLPVGWFSRGSSSPIAPPGQHTPYTLALLRSWSDSGAPLQLDPFTVDEFVAKRVKQLDPSVSVLAAIDQADDVFAGPRSRRAQRQRFLRELADALQQPNLHLLICVRDEALPRFTDALGEGAHIRIGDLEPSQARMAVIKPGGFDARAADDLIEAIRTSHLIDGGGNERQVVADRVEPALLQTACAWLWGLIPERTRTITHRELRRRRSHIDHALSVQCAAAISAVADVHGIPVGTLKSWLLHTFIAAAGGRQDASEGATKTAGQANAITRALEDRHLLRARAGAPPGARIYRLISDRIIEPLRHAPDNLRDEGDPGEYLLAAERALTAGDVTVAERYAELARLTAPDTDLVLHGNARSLLGNIARGRNELRQAEQHYSDALHLFETAMEYAMVSLLLVAIGRTRIARGDLLAGISALRAAVLRLPTDTTIQTELSAAVQELAWRLPGGNGQSKVSPA